MAEENKETGEEPRERLMSNISIFIFYKDLLSAFES